MKKGPACLLAFSLVMGVPSLDVAKDELHREIYEMPWTGSSAMALKLFKNAEASDLRDPNLWFKLGMVLYDGRSYRPSLACFRRVAETGRGCCVLLRFGAHVWQGHILDLLELRDQALKSYRRALALEKKNRGLNMRHDQYDLAVNRAWVAARLKTPFVR